ncbi:glycosyltransferase [Methylocapsa sp. S129]|uniref:glycosyltransferase n=1 Tax=Methylocapsa sp. S129 TaxID=1641869 RepID=UPI00131B6B3F|nr:glycosyltransferase [Methylocapsa sp. S129]
MNLVLAVIAFAIWAYLLLARGAFWRARERDEFWAQDADPLRWPDVVAIIPARDEAECVGKCVASLLRQDYRGQFSIVLVDDESSDGTSEVAKAAAISCGAEERLTILRGAPRSPGWSGKVWAMRQGLEEVGKSAAPPERLLFCDADIAFAPDILSALVRRAEVGNCVLVSLMAKLRCKSRAERALIPAFVFFFQMLYPFAWVNDPRARTAAAAGGCMLADRQALLHAGGFEAMRGALIDDCALAALMKRHGAIALGLTRGVVSLRAYPRFGDIGAMVARSAYAQLDYSFIKLAGVAAGMVVTFLVAPVVALFASDVAALIGLIAWIFMALAFQPMLRFYGRATSWGLVLPLIAAAYLAFTLKSAYLYWRGRGGLWKGRAQAINSAGGEKA